MKCAGGLAKKEREQIFELFIRNIRLKFNQIEKAINIRSNMVSYHLKEMQKEGLIEKKEEYYGLTKTAEKYLPIMPQVMGKELGPLPVVLIALTRKNKILLIKRNKRPYQNYWSMIGGKMRLEENFEEASRRLIKEKTAIDAQYEGLKSIMHEQVIGDEIIKHGFILFFTKMTTKEAGFKESEHGKLGWFSINKIKNEKIIPSDAWLIKNKLNSRTRIASIQINEKQGDLVSFKIRK